jgi:hypothetical protein
MLRPAHHGVDDAVVEIDLERQPGEVGGGELEGGLRQVDAVVVARCLEFPFDFVCGS